MIPVTQTKVVVKNSKGEEVVRGNCFAAVIASMMELPIEQVPNVEVFFHIPNSSYWAEVMHTFLSSKGWELWGDDRFRVFHDQLKSWEDKEECLSLCKDKLYLASGLSARGVRHICIYKNGELVHDPHPTREGLLTFEDFQTLEPKGTN